MKIAIIVIVLAIIIYFVVFRKGNLKFWQKVQQNPDLAYHHFLKSDCWSVVDGINEHNQPSRESGEWDGPYSLNVPSIGRSVKIYGKVDSYEQDEKEFLKTLP